MCFNIFKASKDSIMNGAEAEDLAKKGPPTFWNSPPTENQAVGSKQVLGFSETTVHPLTLENMPANFSVYSAFFKMTSDTMIKAFAATTPGYVHFSFLISTCPTFNKKTF